MCACGDRAFTLLTWLGYRVDDAGALVWTTPRGTVALGLDLKAHPTRTTLLALVVRGLL